MKDDVKQFGKRKSTATDLSQYTFGKIPPQVTQLERYVLGALLVSPNAILLVAKILKPEHFYLPNHQLIYSAVIRLFADNKPIDELTVIHDLTKTGSLEDAGGAFTISQLASGIVSTSAVEHNSLIIKQKWIAREIIRISSTNIRDAYEDTSDELEMLSACISDFTNVLNDVSGNSFKSFKVIVDERIKEITDARKRPEESRYVIGKPTGIYTLDRKLLGYCNPDLIIVAARPSAGKSTFALQGVYKNAIANNAVGFFSLEMSGGQLVDKLISRHTQIDSDRIRTGQLTTDELEQVLEAQLYFQKLPIYVNDSTFDLQSIVAIAKGWKAKYNIQLLFIDYLQLVELHEQKTINTREQVVSHISRKLKLLAKDLDIPIIALSQMSRAMEHRAGDNKRPTLADLRESGGLEQDASVVMFLFNPAEHGIMSYDDGQSTAGVTEIIIRKNRLGAKDTVMVKYKREFNTFDDSDFSNYKFGYAKKEEVPHPDARITPMPKGKEEDFLLDEF